MWDGALRRKGATVDILITDVGEDREFDALDEIRAVIRDEHWRTKPRRWEYAGRAGYDMLLHGRGGPTPPTEFRYEQLPWLRADHLRQGAGAYPPDLHELINKQTWQRIWQDGPGGAVRLTDPEGTDLTFTCTRSTSRGRDRRREVRPSARPPAVTDLPAPDGRLGDRPGHPERSPQRSRRQRDRPGRGGLWRSRIDACRAMGAPGSGNHRARCLCGLCSRSGAGFIYS